MPATFDVTPVVLEGEHVRLEPLKVSHAAGLFEIGQVAEDWAYMPRGCFSSEADCRRWIEESLAALDQLAFVIIERRLHRAAGSTRFLSIRSQHRGLEIGWTWLGRPWQRSPVNTETKLLLMRHAFETLGAVRVEFKTDQRNLRSQAALERIGARREGVLRQHMVARGGFLRNSVYFSVLDGEWPAVRRNLQEKLAGRQPSE